MDGIFQNANDGHYINWIAKHPSQKYVAAGDDLGLVKMYKFPWAPNSTSNFYRAHT